MSSRMQITLEHEAATATVTELACGEFEIAVHKRDPSLFVPRSRWRTAYPLGLIQKIFSLKGPAFLCEEIARDEDPTYLQNSIHWGIFSYIEKEQLNGARILEFGSGCGASTTILARLLPESRFVGVELRSQAVGVARARARFYGLDNIEFRLSPNPNELPPAVGQFDCVLMPAVYEHLLPGERRALLPRIWSLLKPGGVLFVFMTPYRYFPVETHTTSGLPLINYLPDWLAYRAAVRFSRRNLAGCDWPTLLRRGIRGGSISEIVGILRDDGREPNLLDPRHLGVRDRVDLWYHQKPQGRRGPARAQYRWFAKLLKRITGVELLPNLSIAIQRGGGDARATR